MKLTSSALLSFLVLGIVPAAADPFCDSLKAVIVMAPGGFSMLEGDLTNNSPDENSTQRRGTYLIEGAGGCVVNHGTEYWCDYSNTDPDMMVAKIATCLPDAAHDYPAEFKTAEGVLVDVDSQADTASLIIEKPE